MERNKGFLVLDNEVEVLEEQGLFYHWFNIDGEKYFFKVPLELCDMYKELFGCEVARSLGIPTVSYDLAVWNQGRRKVKGVISKTYNPSNLKEISLEDVLKKYVMDVKGIVCDDRGLLNERFNNLKTIWEALCFYYNKGEVVKELMMEIVNSFILQICIGNSDLQAHNIKIFDGERPSLVPNFDYERAMNIDLEFDSFDYKLKVFSNDGSNVSTIKNFFFSFGEEFRSYFIDKISMLPSSLEVFRKIEEKIGSSVPRSYKSDMSFYYESYRGYLQDMFLNNDMQRK